LTLLQLIKQIDESQIYTMCTSRQIAYNL